MVIPKGLRGAGSEAREFFFIHALTIPINHGSLDPLSPAMLRYALTASRYSFKTEAFRGLASGDSARHAAPPPGLRGIQEVISMRKGPTRQL